MLANFIGGTVVTEAVFTYPGLGRLLIQAIGSRDYPLIQGCILFILVIYVLMNLLVDILYAYIDPRIEYR
jgi:peptide/nickel transport system permease protein